MQLEGINKTKIILRIMACIEEQGQLRALRRIAKTVAETIVQARQHHRTLLGLMAVTVVDLLRQGHLALSMAKQGRAHLAYIRASLCVFTACGDVASGMKRLHKGRKVGAVIAHGIQGNGFTCDDIRHDVLPDGARRG